MHSVSVVIPTRERAANLPRVLAPLLADAGAGEIIVVADVDPEALALVGAMAGGDRRLRAIRAPAAGPGAARQAGLEEARGAIVLLLDDDVLASPALASGHAAAHAARTGCVIVGPMPVADARSVPDRLYAEAYDRWLAACRRDPATLLERLWLGNVSLAREDALRIGLAAPRMRDARHEDRELGLRLRQAGLVAALDDRLVARHEHSRTVDQFALDCRRDGAGLRALHELHGTPLPRPLPGAGPIARVCRPLAARSLLAGRVLRRAEISRGAFR